MSEGPTNTPYQARERLEERRDVARVAFGEESQRTDLRAEVARRDKLRKDKAREQDQQNTRFQIMVSRHYAALHANVMKAISNVQIKIYNAIIDIEKQLKQAQSDLSSVLERANKLQDGTPVFRHEDGQIRTDKGRVLSEDEAASLVWHDDMPSGEEYDRARNHIDDLQGKLVILKGYDVEVRGLEEQAAKLEGQDTEENAKQLESIQFRADEVSQSVDRLTKSTPETPVMKHETLTPQDIKLDYFQ